VQNGINSFSPIPFTGGFLAPSQKQAQAHSEKELVFSGKSAPAGFYS
jgi:hypothetical protein